MRRVRESVHIRSFFGYIRVYMARKGTEEWELNKIQSGDFLGQYLYVMGSFVFIREKMFAKEKTRYPIKDYELINTDVDNHTGAEAAGFLLGGWIGAWLGSSVPQTRSYCVKVRYGADYSSTEWISENEYNSLRQYNMNAKPLMKIKVKINK